MFRRLKKRGFFFASAQAHPTPTILNFERSADCLTYTFSWTYNNFPVGSTSQTVTFAVQSVSATWNSIFTNLAYASYRSYSLTYSNLINAPYSLYLGKAVTARYSVNSVGTYTSASAAYALTSDTDFIKQKPGVMLAAPTITQTTA